MTYVSNKLLIKKTPQAFFSQKGVDGCSISLAKARTNMSMK